jgi:hypothetical protein
MYKIIFTHSWWSVGESLANINIILNFIVFLKQKFPNKFYIILNISGNELNMTYSLDSENIMKLCDEFYLDENIYHPNVIVHNDNFIQLHDCCFINKNEYNLELENIFHPNKEGNTVISKLLYDVYNWKHPLNKIRHYVPVLPNNEVVPPNNNDSNDFKIFCDVNEHIKKIVDNILIEKEINDYESIHFRWNEHIPHVCEDDVIIYWIERLTPLINPDKIYFLTSNHPKFYYFFEKKFPNCFYIKRDEYIKTIENDFTKYKQNDIFDYIAHIDLRLVCRSKNIIHLTDGVREMISLFLWLPILQYKIPITWVTFHNFVYREYSINGCHNQKILGSNYMETVIPKCVCDITQGRLCENNKTKLN